jgi:hypothetical protein
VSVAIPTVEASVAKVNVESELNPGRIRDGAEMSRNLRVSKASKQASITVTFCGKDFRIKSFNYTVRSIE